ncbi:MAG: hypothetical protein AAFP70_17980 [Calditrichota bacterium]
MSRRKIALNIKSLVLKELRPRSNRNFHYYLEMELNSLLRNTSATAGAIEAGLKESIKMPANKNKNAMSDAKLAREVAKIMISRMDKAKR